MKAGLLGDNAEILSGFAFKSESFNSDERGMPLVRIRDVVPGETSTYFDGSYEDRFVINRGEILIGMDGDFNRARWQGRPALLNQRVCKITAHSRLHDGYLFHLLPEILQAISDRTPFVTVKHLSAKDLRETEIPLPPLEEQKRIAAILDQADTLRRLRARALTRLNALGQAIFHEMFLANLDDAKSLPLSEVVYFQEGPGVRNWQFRDEGIKLINVGNIVDGHLNLGKTNRYLDPEEVDQKYRHFMLDPGDFVLASSGVTWGKIAEVADEHLPLCLNTSMIRVRPKDSRVLRGYLRGFVEMGNFRSQIDRLITGSAQPNFGPSHLKQIMIPLPNADDQAAFEHKIAGISELSKSARLAMSTSEALFTSLQHRAFRGEL